MNNLGKWKGIIFILTIIFFVACGLYRASLNVKTPLTDRISNYETVLIYVTTMVPDSAEQASILEEYIIKNLNKKAIFKKVVASSAEPDASTDLRLNAKILNLKKAGIVSTMFTGGGGGVIVEVSLIDVKTGATIGTFESRRSSGSSTTKDVLFDVAKRMAEYMKENM